MSGEILTVESITNLYLFGTVSTPGNLDSESFIRDSAARGTVTVDISQYMEDGPGRFALGSRFTMVDRFFDLTNSLPPGSYTKAQLAPLVGLTTNDD